MCLIRSVVLPLAAALLMICTPAWSQTSPWSAGSGGAIYYNGGNVGVGTASPDALLTLYQTQNTLSYLDYYNVSTGSSAGIDLRLITQNAGNTGLAIIDMVKYQSGPFVISNNDSTGTISFNTANAERLHISANGNVGIGTTNPQHLLHVAGTIGAEEVLVTSTGADYVFEPGYQLQPLSEVAAYIKANHHLPDIPSADEVKQMGMGVGEMEAKLLAKIEELTMHMIKAEERADRLEKQNKELQSEIESLNERIEK